MSITYIDSMSRYGSTDKASATGFLQRYGWTLVNNRFRHRTQASMFGQPYISIHNDWYDDGEGTSGITLHNIQRPVSGNFGVSFKFAMYWSGGPQSGWRQAASILRTGGNPVAVGFHAQNAANTCNLTDFGAWSNASAGPAQEGKFTANTTSTVVNGFNQNAPNANVTTLAWYAVDIFLSGSGASTVLNWRVVTPTGHVHQNVLTINSGTVTGLVLGNAYGVPSNFNTLSEGFCYSDVVIYSNDGVGLTGFPDNPRNFRVQRLLPDGNGTQNSWAPVTGTNFGAVNETPYADANYSSGSGIGTKQTFHFGALGTATESVKAVSAIQLNPNILDAGTLVTAAAPIQIIGGTETSMGSNLVPSRVAFANSPRILTVNPATSQPYTAAQVSDMEAGFNLA